MENKTGQIIGTKNCKLYYQTWQPDQPAKAVVAIVHGVGEHSDRYQNLVTALIDAGFAASASDHRGHGRSDGPRGHINSWDDFRQDTKIFIEQTRKDFPGLPVFIYGHSMGSLISLDYIQHYPNGLKGAIISGTATQPTSAAPSYQVMIAKLLSNVAPKTTLKVPLDGSGTQPRS